MFLVIGMIGLICAVFIGLQHSEAQVRPATPTYDPELREINERLTALEMAITRFSREHGSIMFDQAKGNADLAATKARVDMVFKQLDDITKSGTPMDSGRLAALETKMNLILWFAGTLVAGLIALETARVRIVAKRK